MAPTELPPQVGFQACRDTDRVGVVVGVHEPKHESEEEDGSSSSTTTSTLDVRWPDTDIIETSIPFSPASIEDHQIMVAVRFIHHDRA